MGFSHLIKEIHDVAGQHEVIAENLTNNVQRSLQNLIKELKQERARVINIIVFLIIYFLSIIIEAVFGLDFKAFVAIWFIVEYRQTCNRQSPYKRT